MSGGIYVLFVESAVEKNADAGGVLVVVAQAFGWTVDDATIIFDGIDH